MSLCAFFDLDLINHAGNSTCLEHFAALLESLQTGVGGLTSYLVFQDQGIPGFDSSFHLTISQLAAQSIRWKGFGGLRRPKGDIDALNYELKAKLFADLHSTNIFRIVCPHAISQKSAVDVSEVTTLSIDSRSSVDRASIEKLHAVTRDILSKSEIEGSWSIKSFFENRNITLNDFANAVSLLELSGGDLLKNELESLSSSIENNEKVVRSIFRMENKRNLDNWAIEGPIYGSYSLAEINREFSIALTKLGKNVSLSPVSREGAPTEWLRKQSVLGTGLGLIGREFSCFDVVSGNNYPPEVSDYVGCVNILHGYAWEETGFPVRHVADFNSYLDGIAVASQHTKKILIDNGVTIPIFVSGIGLKEINTRPEDPLLRKAPFTFLHISSWFPRKGGDVLLDAFGQAFSEHDGVRLVIKTFPNPHNKIETQLKQLRQKYPHHAPIVLIENELSDQEISRLYEDADILVMPSRAEGFGLPAAEALLKDKRVITTGWSGLREISESNSIKYIDFEFQRAKSHLGLFDSMWAEPSVSHLVQLMREAVSEEWVARSKSVVESKRLLMSRYSWSTVAEKISRFASHLTEQNFTEKPKIALITTWNTRCGIAEYSRYLIGDDNSSVKILATRDTGLVYPDTIHVDRVWDKWSDASLIAMANKVVADGVQVVALQFHWGFFTAQGISALIRRLKAAKVVVVATLHSTKPESDYPQSDFNLVMSALADCDRVLVHSIADVNNLKLHGLVSNVTLFPHGVRRPPGKSSLASRGGTFLMGTFGFALPHKGLEEFILAAALLRRRGLDFKIQMFNAEYPTSDSREIVTKCRQLIKRLGLSKTVELDAEFLPDDVALQKLADMNLVVYPYQNTNESASGAIRFGIGSGVPVAATPLKIFEDVSDVVEFLPGTSPEEIADGLEILIRKAGVTGEDEQAKQKRMDWLEFHDFSHLGYRYKNILTSLHINAVFDASFAVASEP